MWSVPRPELSVRAVYQSCIRNAHPKTKTRLAGLEDSVTDAARRFEEAAVAAALHTLADLKDQPTDGTTRTELTKNYTQRMVRRGTAGRAHYDQIKASAPLGRCPLCGHRLVETIDHQLPKQSYPLLAVVPTNLVPACRSCNTIKGEIVPVSAAEQTLHPYFDDLGDQQWLHARVHEVAPAVVQFLVDPPTQWDQVLADRVRRHFRIFQLAELYGAQAAEETAALRYYLRGKDASVLSAHLQETADSWFHVDRNHWKAAMYQALAKSDWYINGGFEKV